MAAQWLSRSKKFSDPHGVPLRLGLPRAILPSKSGDGSRVGDAASGAAGAQQRLEGEAFLGGDPVLQADGPLGSQEVQFPTTL